MTEVHDRTTTVLARAGVIRISFGDPKAPAGKVELSAEAAEQLAQDIQRVLSGLGHNPAAP
ncbi:hypothetical protein [uncultured Paracoccus sp.]|uniref:hypothetical protein n=1 Tax=uncultured Paracoccus sp. TaxID=189685 RepID=UPI0025DCFE03|nr:hypothetical protein [uncultured Paracoccus sp.]